MCLLVAVETDAEDLTQFDKHKNVMVLTALANSQSIGQYSMRVLHKGVCDRDVRRSRVTEVPVEKLYPSHLPLR